MSIVSESYGIYYVLSSVVIDIRLLSTLAYATVFDIYDRIVNYIVRICG